MHGSGPSIDPDPRIGTVLQGRYKVVARVSSGGMGSVYRGERLQLGRAVAIKFLHAAYSNEKEFLRRFDVEARAMSRLGHPHCVSVIDFGVDDVPYVIMEYIAGPTLREVMDAGRLPSWRALLIARQLLAGLAHAHKHGIVHRDVKPANIMLTEATGMGDHIRILDFGLAKLRDEKTGEQSATAPLAIGTPAYMSPEQARGERVDARSDVYSAGVVLFELLTGRKPFYSDEPFALLRMHMEDPAPSLIKAAPAAGLSLKLDAVIRKAMAKAPEDRYQTAAEFADALDATPDATDLFRRRAEANAAGSADTLAMDEVSLSDIEERNTKRKSGLIIAVVAVAALAGGGAAWVGLRKSPAPDASADSVPSGSRVPAPVPGSVPEPVPVPVPASPPDAAPVLALATPPDAGADTMPGAPEDVPVSDEQIDAKPPIGEGDPIVEPNPSRPVKTVKDAEQLIKDGRRDDAIAGLRKLRRANPRNARVHYLLGNLYFDKLWWSDAIDAYRLAIRANKGFRSSGALNKNTIRALGYQKTYAKAATLIAGDIGKAALPYLDRAARADSNATVRQRAADLAKRLRKKRR